MADVSVEFGAVDVGLQKTLSKIQNEMAGLRSSVKSGELSMEELEKTMRRIGQVESMEKRIKSMGDNSAASASQVNRLEGELRQLDRANDSVNAGSMSFGKLTGAISAAYAAVMGFQEAFMFIGDSIKKSSDLAETMNVVNVVFGSAATAVSDFAATAVKSLGMTRNEALDAASTFAIFGKSAGLAGSELVGFSTNLVKLATDFASFRNTTPAEAIQAIGAALRGESEPIRKYGVLLDDATLKAEAMKLGLYDGTGALDAQVKSLAAYNAILSQSKDAQGDFTNTSDSLSNQLKILSATFNELKTSIGDGLQQPTLGAVSSLNEGLIPALQGAIKYGKEFLGVLSSTPSNTSIAGRSVNVVAESLSGFNYYALKAFNFLTPFDDLMQVLSNKGKEAAAGQQAAADGVKNTGDAAASAAPQIDQAASKLTKAGLEAAAASGEFTGLGDKANETSASIAEAFTINSDFKPAVDGITSGWSDLNSQISGTKPLLESNFSLNDSIAGKIEEQTQGIGNLNKQLETSKDLEELIKDIKTVRSQKEKEASAKESERQAELRTSLELDLESLKAQISGNEQEQKAVQYKKDYNAALKQSIDAGMGEPEARAFANQIARARQEQAGMNVELTQSAKLMKDIADAQSKDAVDPGGRLQKQAQGQIEKGNFVGAQKTAASLAANEVVASIRGVGKGRDTRSMADIGKDYGVRQQLGESSADFASRVRDVREGAATVDKFGASKKIPASGSGVDRPGQDGTKPPEKKSEKSGAATLDTLVGKIKDLLEKIEPRLPVAALTA